MEKDNDSPRPPIPSKEKLRKLPNMNRPVDDIPFDPNGDIVEYEYEGEPGPAAPGYDPDIGRLSALWNAQRKAADAAEWDRFCQEHPEAQHLRRITAPARLTKPSIEGASKIPPAIIRQMLLPGWVDRTKIAILEAVTAQFPGHSISKNIWTKTQAQWQREKLQECVANGPRAFQGAKVGRCKTLAEFRSALQGHALAAEGSRTYNAKITVTDEGLTINGFALRYSKNTVKGKVYRGIRLSSVEPLLEAIERGRKPISKRVKGLG